MEEATKALYKLVFESKCSKTNITERKLALQVAFTFSLFLFSDSLDRSSSLCNLEILIEYPKQMVGYKANYKPKKIEVILSMVVEEYMNYHGLPAIK